MSDCKLSIQLGKKSWRGVLWTPSSEEEEHAQPLLRLPPPPERVSMAAAFPVIATLLLITSLSLASEMPAAGFHMMPGGNTRQRLTINYRWRVLI